MHFIDLHFYFQILLWIFCYLTLICDLTLLQKQLKHESKPYVWNHCWESLGAVKVSTTCASLNFWVLTAATCLSKGVIRLHAQSQTIDGPTDHIFPCSFSRCGAGRRWSRRTRVWQFLSLIIHDDLRDIGRAAPCVLILLFEAAYYLWLADRCS